MIVLLWIRFSIAALLMIGGLFLLFSVLVGLFRFNNVLNRVHVAAKCDTLGLLLTLSSLIVMHGWSYVSLKLLLILIFFWLSVPVSGHLIAYMEVMTNNKKVSEECKVIIQC